MEALQNILSIAGCIALFIFGMKLLSDGVESISGIKVKLFTHQLTRNRFSSFLTGLGLTSLFQSSSAISVLVLSFVNAGLLNLRKAFAIIIGANIGTTSTLWLIAIGAFGFNIYAIALPLLCISVPMHLSKKYSDIGLAFIGFSLIFLSLKMLNLVFPADFHEEVIFKAFSDRFEQNQYGFLFIVLFITFVLTVIVQSSSAATAFIITLLAKGYINLDVALAFVLGANIGTTFTAIIASFVGNIYAKYVAYFHLIFNLTGVLFFFGFIPAIAKILPVATEFILDIPSFFGLKSWIVDTENGTYKAISLAIFHTLFNAVTAIPFLFLVPFIADFVTEKAKKETSKNQESSVLPTNRSISQELHIYEGNKIIKKFLGNTVQTIDNLNALITESNKELFDEIYNRILALENQGDDLKKEVLSYFNSIDHKLMDKNSFKRKQALLEVAHHLESVGDVAIKIAEIHQKRRKSSSYITPKLRNFLFDIQKNLTYAITILIQNLDEPGKEINLKIPREIENEINKIYFLAEKNLMKAMAKEKIPALSTIYYKELIINYELIGDHLYDANYAIAYESEN